MDQFREYRFNCHVKAQRKEMSPRLNMGGSVLHPCGYLLCVPKLNMGDSAFAQKFEAYAEMTKMKTVAECGVIKDGEGPKCLVELGSAARVVGGKILGRRAYGSQENKAYPGEDVPMRFLDYSPVPTEP